MLKLAIIAALIALVMTLDYHDQVRMAETGRTTLKIGVIK